MAGNLDWEDKNAWPDFYALLQVDPNADSDTLRRAINATYARASALCDHRDLNTRFANQILTERVLPQCRRILLDSTLRRAYDDQWQLHCVSEEAAQSYHAFLADLECRSAVDWPVGGGSFNAEATDFLPNVRSQAIEMVPERRNKKEKPQPVELLEGEVIEAKSMVPLVVPTTRASIEKGEKMKGRYTEIKGGVTFDQLQPRRKRQTITSSGRSLAVGALLGAVVVGGLGAAWAGGLLGGQDKNQNAPPPVAQRAPQAAAPKVAPRAAAPATIAKIEKDEQSENKPPAQAGQPGTPPGKALLPLNTLVQNSDFEGGQLGAWKASNTHAYSEMPPGMPNPRSGDYVMTMWDSQPYAVSIEQIVRDLKPGTYSLSAWVRRSGGQSVATMSVSDHGDQRRETTIPATLNWTQIFIRDIKISSGQCKIEFSTAGGGLKWVQVDAVEFHAN